MMKKIFAVILILAVFMDLTAYAASIDSQIKSQQRSQSDMKKKIQKYNAIAREKSKQSKTLLGQLSRLRQDASASKAKMDDLEKENIKLQNSVGELNKNIAHVRDSINAIIRTLRARVLDIYKHTPEENSLSLIITSNGPHDALNTAYMLQCFARQDSAMIEELAKREEELKAAKKRLENNKSQILRQTEELKKKRAEYDSTIKKTDSLLKNVQSEQKQAEAAAKELEAAQRAVGNKINSLMKQKKNNAAKKSQSAEKNSSSAKSQSAPTTSKSSVKTLIWPVNGTVTMQYGSRVHPVFKTKIFNSGIDIKAAAGTPVKAAGPGEVLYQGWLKGFGQVIIIDHGGDLSTVYAHLGGASVREGSTVKAGTVIGRVGNSGTDSEFGLHFEVRKNGSAQNPMNFLKR
ncbi:MAG: peptidoglycan DD-metalloendopeptidase family protein [Synergistales bacterium]|nr:peptidoglycan DD-metalloendopeptidase family protein [Synergistales bacterium]MDY6400750.1 peptidoglycan DD-metalloendopeptidase family protein [Synergistales bacterium]MDY6404574.1 peptidoglycan DD-metalloendopeptidase family protein [Synergistales bacterium]MDY6411200.1 peptidoglycan DD-metalloendopeptidase family protein [Synergistales bacterium]MDY6413602.1 peptidoglycan DD-metalloendopeptidase family protein [Synergistales bacterium]